MRALVTGISGFTGPYVCKELEALGYDVVGTCFREASLGEVLDICDEEAVAALVNRLTPDVCVHLAALSFVPHTKVEDVYRTHILGTRNLLKAFAHSSKTPKNILLASTAQVYGANESGEPLDEDTKVHPMNDYAVSKLSMEYMAALWKDHLPITLVRPFNYTGRGQGQHFLLPKIVGHFVRREPSIELGNLDVSRDFSDVRFVAQAYAKLIEKEGCGEVYNVCSSTAHSLRAIVSMLEEMAGYRITIKVNPAFVRKNDVKRLVGSGDKLAKAIGRIDPIPLKETLQWMYH